MNEFIRKTENGFYTFDTKAYLSSIPKDLEYLAVDEEHQTIYGLGRGYKEQVENKIAELEKALELACETYWNDCGMEDCPVDMPDGFSDTYKKCASCFNGGDRVINDKGCCYVDYFKAKAKEMMKSE